MKKSQSAHPKEFKSNSVIEQHQTKIAETNRYIQTPRMSSQDIDEIDKHSVNSNLKQSALSQANERLLDNNKPPDKSEDWSIMSRIAPE